jgi:hypothetical protein
MVNEHFDPKYDHHLDQNQDLDLDCMFLVLDCLLVVLDEMVNQYALVVEGHSRLYHNCLVLDSHLRRRATYSSVPRIGSAARLTQMMPRLRMPLEAVHLHFSPVEGAREFEWVSFRDRTLLLACRHQDLD